jgi:anti-anti-sigma factor
MRKSTVLDVAGVRITPVRSPFRSARKPAVAEVLRRPGQRRRLPACSEALDVHWDGELRVDESVVGAGTDMPAHGLRCPATLLSKRARGVFRILSARNASVRARTAETEDPNVLHVGVVGELDLTNARGSRIASTVSTRYPSGLVLDLNRVVFIDSAALHVLFRPRRHRIGIVLSPTSPIARTVEIVGLAEATALGDSLDAVVDALAQR